MRRTWALVLVFAGCRALVQPATCTQRGVVSTDFDQRFSVSSMSSDEPDGGVVRLYTLSLGPGQGGHAELPQVIAISNVAYSEYRPEFMELDFQPADETLPVEVRFKATCLGNPAPVLRAVLEPTDAGYAVTLSDVP